MRKRRQAETDEADVDPAERERERVKFAVCSKLIGRTEKETASTN